ncbi:ROK family protein [Phytoactinopolyspora alkaliphila]|uniref:ROK family protein n=1 Tax=Phytoactinopolyspora alkaliphila TaxID=1783498 RepID=A0A6N9YPG6_9ACTN|nr:ROK family protein [Phytoactinopolyspora alkaliphila]NED96872.1 ROK family protein [Phytoactinopolyspora alkaliphila]
MTKPMASNADSFKSDSGAIASAAAVVAAIRPLPDGASRAEVGSTTGLSKAVISERVRALVDAGLLQEAGEFGSSGGRRATRIRLRPDRVVFAAEIAMTHVRAAVVNLGGEILADGKLSISMREGPDIVLHELEQLMDRELARARERFGDGLVLCGTGVGIAGPVEFTTGRTVHPPVHPDWHDQPVRDRLAIRFGVPAWADNEVNLMALAEQSLGAGIGVADSLVVKIGSWVGAGLISNGRLHRGAQGSAGSLATTAGGDDIAARAELIALSGQSQALARAARDRPITAQVVAELAQLGDRDCRTIIDDAALDIGSLVSVIVDFFNPALLVVTGGVTSGGGEFLARIRETIYRKSLALATRDLRIVPSELGADAAVRGAAVMAVDELTTPAMLADTLGRLARAVAPGRVK